jgi:hypothetical protein
MMDFQQQQQHQASSDAPPDDKHEPSLLLRVVMMSGYSTKELQWISSMSIGICRMIWIDDDDNCSAIVNDDPFQS